MTNKDVYDMEKNYAGKSDIQIRDSKKVWWYIDVDSVWVNNKSLEIGTQNFFKYESFCTHKFYKFLNEDDKIKFMEYCPESKIIYRINYQNN